MRHGATKQEYEAIGRGRDAAEDLAHSILAIDEMTRSKR